MFMHNGFIGNWSGLRRHVEELIPDVLYPSRTGTPLVTCITNGGHEFNPDAPGLMVEFFQEHP